MPSPLPGVDILARGVTPEAALAFWAWKSALPYNEAKKLSTGAKQRAFYIAALAERDAVQAVKDALGEALKNGETLKDFKARCIDIIDKQGWNNHRVEVIFRNNLQTAYAAGRYSKMQQVKASRPYWQYLVIRDNRTRPGHALLAGLVYPADHEFWDTNYPPNGHKCRCTVCSLSSRQVKAKGLPVQEEMPSGTQWVDPRTGVPQQIARPGADEGWRTNPGKLWTSGLDLEKYEDLTAGSYAEQRVRPQRIKNFEELAAEIRLRAGKYLRNSDGFVAITQDRKSYFMATDCRGKLWLSAQKFPTPKGVFQPTGGLKSAWNKLAKGEKLDWLEEYSVESLWHEITHNRQTHTRALGVGDKRIMEVITQWTARRTYPEFLHSLGGKTAHLESIKKEGLGYGLPVRNFDTLLASMGIGEAALLGLMHKLIDGVDSQKYADGLASFFAERSGKSKEGIAKILKGLGVNEEEFSVIMKQNLGG